MKEKMMVLMSLLAFLMLLAPEAQAAEALPIPLNGGLMTSLKAAGQNPRLFTEIHYDQVLKNPVPFEKYTEFLRGQVVYLSNEARVNPKKIREYFQFLRGESLTAALTQKGGKTVKKNSPEISNPRPPENLTSGRARLTMATARQPNRSWPAAAPKQQLPTGPTGSTQAQPIKTIEVLLAKGYTYTTEKPLPSSSQEVILDGYQKMRLEKGWEFPAFRVHPPGNSSGNDSSDFYPRNLALWMIWYRCQQRLRESPETVMLSAGPYHYRCQSSPADQANNSSPSRAWRK